MTLLKLRWVLNVLRTIGLHFFADDGVSSCRKIFIFLVATAISWIATIILNFHMSYLRYKAYTNGNVGLVTGLVDTARLLSVIVSLFSHFAVMSIWKRTFEKLYKSRIVVSSDVPGSASILLAGAVLCVRIGLMGFMLRTAGMLRRYLNIAWNMVLVLNSFGVFLVVFQFAAILETLCRRMDELTRRLSVPCDRIRESEMVDLIKKQDHLIRFMTKVNNLFGYQILTGVAFVFMEFTVDMYYILFACILELAKKFQLLHLLYLVQNTFTLLFLGQFLHVIASSTDGSCTSVDAFYKELFRLMRESKTLCSNKKLCLYVSMRKTVNFTACGFFNLGYPLITSIIAAATTYLVILVQFSLPKSS